MHQGRFSSVRKALSGLLNPAVEHDPLRRCACTILIVGPSGSGKTTLVRDVLQSYNYRIRRITPRDMSDDDAGILENNIMSYFQSNPEDQDVTENENDEASSRTAVFIDDLDMWAPQRTSSETDLRFIATLSDALTSLQEEAVGEQDGLHPRIGNPVFVATASSVQDVHPALVEAGLFTNVFHVHALSFSERENASRMFLERCNKSGDMAAQKLREVATEVALVTPGFLIGDMQPVFARLQDWYGEENRSLASVRDHIRGIRPSLLVSMMPFTNPIACSPQLHGLDEPMRKLKECLYATFCKHDADAPQTTMQALEAVGRVRGAIIYGPTGSGKTALAHMAARLLPEGMVNVLCIDGASIVSSVVGEAERSLRRVFEVARQIAPTVVVVDNVDMLAPKRDAQSQGDGSSSSQAFERLLSTFLVELDGIGPSGNDILRGTNDGDVFVMATTRALGLVDGALLRPGRLEVRIEVLKPHREARMGMLKRFCGERGFEVHNVDWFEEFGQKTEGWCAEEVLAVGRSLIMDQIRSRRATGVKA